MCVQSQTHVSQDEIASFIPNFMRSDARLGGNIKLRRKTHSNSEGKYPGQNIVFREKHIPNFSHSRDLQYTIKYTVK